MIYNYLINKCSDTLNYRIASDILGENYISFFIQANLISKTDYEQLELKKKCVLCFKDSYIVLRSSAINICGELWYEVFCINKDGISKEKINGKIWNIEFKSNEENINFIKHKLEIT